jgi:FkbM family methyltransferase
MNMRPDTEYVPALGLSLPAPQPFALPALSFAYGAADVAARYCGLPRTPPFLRGTWQHGWTGGERQFHPLSLFGESVGLRPGERLWVARKDEENYLRSRGLRGARAIGLPVAYVPRPEVQRRPGTLLVMPVHSIGYTTHRWPMEEYADQVEALRKDFAEVVVCVHPSCWEHGYWVPQFQRRGFPVVRGAHGEDRNGLRRIAALPRYTPGETSLLGPPFRLNDALAFVNAYEQIFRREVYRFATTRAAPLVIDGGANTGLATVWFKRRYPNARVLAFEADPDVFALLKANCAALAPDAELVPRALWTAETTLRFRQEGADAGRLLPDGAAGDEAVAVPTVRLRDYLDQEVDLLKLDVEGVETDLLEDCKDRLGNVRNLFVEYHSFVGRPQTLDRLLATLREAGFRVHVHAPAEAPSPLVSRPGYLGMDLQLNVFAFR